MPICNKEKHCYSPFKDKLSPFCTARFKLDPQGKGKVGGIYGECE